MMPVRYLCAPMPADENWIIDICDRLLGEKSYRQHRFHFLLGLPSPGTGRRSTLPVDAYYPSHGLVIEYHERQHRGSVAFWNRITTCGLTRDEQRRHYDNVRREELPKHGIKLIVLDYRSFECDRCGRLRRTPAIEVKLREHLADHLYKGPITWPKSRPWKP
jgi:hypothetical protein